MLRSTKEVLGYSLLAKDGEIGRCKDFLFDDRLWVIRYMLADTGKWLSKRRVLVSPIALGEPNWRERLFPVRLSKKQIEEGPDLVEDPPVSAQFEIEHARHFDYVPYWAGAGLWGPGAVPSALYGLGSLQTEIEQKNAEERRSDPHLRSVHEVRGYYVQATDGTIGHVDDFIVDDRTWQLRYAVIDTINWFPSPKTIVATEWVREIDWQNRKLHVDLRKESVKNAPRFDPNEPVNAVYETRLYDFYGRPHGFRDAGASW